MAERFQYISSVEAETATGIWGWSKRLIEDLNKLRRLWELADMDLTGKAGQTVKVKTDETGFELVP
jgi:hypothetical protein